MPHTTRRVFLKQSMAVGALAGSAGTLGRVMAAEAPQAAAGKMKLGFVTYLWGQDWDLPTLIANCEKAKIFGVEPRVEHKHGLKLSMSADERKAVRKRFADTPVAFLGMGTNECYDSPDPAKLAKSIETTKAWLQFSADCGGSGVKVKPNDFQKGVAHAKTIEQIGKSLDELGKAAADLGQQLRLEVHGSCCELPTIKAIMDIAKHPSVGVCWNCNDEDLKGEGLAANFAMVKDRLGATVHVRELNIGQYPYQELIGLLAKTKFAGWVLLECRTKPTDRVAAMIEQREVFEKMLASV
jgi:sugar phosphate isomerase/epimerase